MPQQDSALARLMIDHFHTVSSPEITLIFCIVDKGQSFEQNIFTGVIAPGLSWAANSPLKI